ncbi:recombinase family protein [Nocardia brevicatena]|uniref:recombinase family protein n=1 Tax=Nocardia brevicatena TaxID=37327 RepID=UPI0002E614B9|nr:recombinase family protein [Nocardia brevicatena]
MRRSAPGTPRRPELDRFDRSVPDARAIDDDLAAPGIKLSFGGQVDDPHDLMGKMLLNILATFAEFEIGLLRMRTREGMALARAEGRLFGRAAQRTVAHARHRRVHRRRPRRTVRRLPTTAYRTIRHGQATQQK